MLKARPAVTAVSRGAMPIAPGTMFGAPVQASGKTRAAGAIGALMGGRRGGITPYVGGIGADAEMVKKIVAMLRAGESFVCFDNIVGFFDSPVLSSVITDGVVNERVLGSNRWYRGDARIMMTGTSNNCQMSADAGRRWLDCRIDPRCERPQSRDFDFDPVERALRERREIGHAVLVLVRAYHVAGAPKLAKGGAGFEDWSRMARMPVLWAGSMGYTVAAGIGPVADPATSIMTGSTATDPETEHWRMALRGLADVFQDEDFQAREVHARLRTAEASNDPSLRLLYDGFAGLLGDRPNDLSATRVGRALAVRRDRIVDGLAVHGAGKDRTGAVWWRVGVVHPPPAEAQSA